MPTDFLTGPFTHLAIDAQSHDLRRNDRNDESLSPLWTRMRDFTDALEPLGVKTIWTAYTPWAWRGFHRPTPMLIKNAKLELCALRPDETIFIKHESDAFRKTLFGQPLKSRLDREGIKTVILSGLWPDDCIARTAEGAAANGFKVIVAHDLLGHRDWDLMKRWVLHSLTPRDRFIPFVSEQMAKAAGITFMTSRDILDHLQGKPALSEDAEIRSSRTSGPTLTL